MLASRLADAVAGSTRVARATAATVAVLAAMAEVAGLRSVGMVANLPLGAQASAVPSLAAYHDIRWVLVYALFSAVLVGIFVTSHAGLARRWWTRWPPWRAMAWAAVDFAVVTGAAVAVDYSPGWVVLLAAVAAGLLNAWCWERLVTACAATAPAPERQAAPAGGLRRAVVPVTLGLAVAGIPVGAASGVPTVGTGYPPAHHLSQGPPPDGRRAVMLANGFQSNWQGNRPADLFGGFYTTQFSYAGLSPSGAPLPYGSRDTTESLRVLASRFAAQVTRLYRLTHKKVDVVAVSEGTYVVRQYLATHPRPPLHVVVLASPLPRPDRVYYPALGHGPGYGFAGGWETHLLLEVSVAESPHEDIRTGMPMIRSLLQQGPLFRQRGLCPVPGVRVVALLPLTAAVDSPPVRWPGSPRAWCPPSTARWSPRAPCGPTSWACCAASRSRASSGGD